jgi:hypothetical protein
MVATAITIVKPAFLVETASITDTVPDGTLKAPSPTFAIPAIMTTMMSITHFIAQPISDPPYAKTRALVNLVALSIG